MYADDDSSLFELPETEKSLVMQLCARWRRFEEEYDLSPDPKVTVFHMETATLLKRWQIDEPRLMHLVREGLPVRLFRKDGQPETINYKIRLILLQHDNGLHGNEQDLPYLSAERWWFSYWDVFAVEKLYADRHGIHPGPLADLFRTTADLRNRYKLTNYELEETIKRYEIPARYFVPHRGVRYADYCQISSNFDRLVFFLGDLWGFESDHWKEIGCFCHYYDLRKLMKSKQKAPQCMCRTRRFRKPAELAKLHNGDIGEMAWKVFPDLNVPATVRNIILKMSQANGLHLDLKTLENQLYDLIGQKIIAPPDAYQPR